MTASTEDRIRRLEDIEEIRLLMARYHMACDGWTDAGTHKDPVAIADLFTDDGVWDIPVPRPAPQGRARILETGKQLQAMNWIVHFVVNPIVEVDGDTATALFKGIVRSRQTADAVPGWGMGIYRAECARTADGWRFRSLAWETVAVLKESPTSDVTASYA